MPPAPSLNQCSLHPDSNLRVPEPQGPVGCLGSHPQAGGGGGGAGKYHVGDCGARAGPRGGELQVSSGTQD